MFSPHSHLWQQASGAEVPDLSPKYASIRSRTILWYLVFLGCGINYMIRSNINIAIVAMVESTELYNESESIRSVCLDVPSPKNTTLSHTVSQDSETNTRLKWDEYEQSHALGAFYWSYWTSQIAGGAMAQKYGAKAVFGLSNLYLCVSTYLIPVLSKLNIWALVVLRISQGLIGGLCWPALHTIVAHWIPPNERSKFVSAYMGSSIGAAITYPLCGVIIHYLGWEAVFYVTSSLGCLWFISWWFLVFDTPSLHPRISQQERLFIQESLGHTVSKQKLPTPWLKIFTSPAAWLTSIVSWGCLWGMFTLFTQAPTYFQYVHGWGIRMNGLLSGIPHVSRVLLGTGLASICDMLLQKEILSRTNVRKLASSCCTLVQGVFLLGLSFCGCNSIAAGFCLTIALATTGAESPGPLANYVDLSPNHAGVLFGFGNLISVTPGFISPFVVGVLTFQNQTVNQWQKVFLISAAMTLIPGILFLVYGTAEIQPWNYNHESKAEEERLNTVSEKKEKSNGKSEQISA